MRGRPLRDRPDWLNRDGSYFSEDQIVKHLVEQANADGREARMWRAVKLSEVIKLHKTMGPEIREAYGLWDRENPHTVQSPGKGENGVIDHPLFPDRVSLRIMQRVWGEFHR